VGVVHVGPRDRRALRRDSRRQQLETFVNQVALAIERGQLADEAATARLRVETEHLRNTLLSSVSHDLRTPLAAITGATSTLLATGERLDAGTRRELLESVHEEAERLARLVQNLLQMTRIEAGALGLRREWHSIEEIIGGALARVESRLAGRRVYTRVPPDLPLVPVDAVLIEQVLVNLLDNALRHTPPASPIRVAATASDEAVSVEVADRGPGLPAGDGRRIFEKFYRGRDAPAGGAGLGLAICEGIVRAHGGRIAAHTLPAGGAAFFFRVPLAGTPPAVLGDE
jgi:two-component system sensor histidine kinase KdpD